MFRTMRRFKQQISDAECVEILKTEKRGALSLIGDAGYPYGIPLSHFYDERDGKIYFHGAKEGHKIDAIKANPKASFCIMDKGFARVFGNGMEERLAALKSAFDVKQIDSAFDDLAFGNAQAVLAQKA